MYEYLLYLCVLYIILQYSNYTVLYSEIIPVHRRLKERFPREAPWTGHVFLPDRTQAAERVRLLRQRSRSMPKLRVYSANAASEPYFSTIAHEESANEVPPTRHGLHAHHESFAGTKYSYYCTVYSYGRIAFALISNRVLVHVQYIILFAFAFASLDSRAHRNNLPERNYRTPYTRDRSRAFSVDAYISCGRPPASGECDSAGRWSSAGCCCWYNGE